MEVKVLSIITPAISYFNLEQEYIATAPPKLLPCIKICLLSISFLLKTCSKMVSASIFKPYSLGSPSLSE